MNRARGITQDRARISLILEQIDELIGQIDASPARLELGQVGIDVVMTLMGTLGDCREIIGDEFVDVAGIAVWHVAARRPMTVEQLDAEMQRRGVRRAS